MALTFPADMPTGGIASVGFNIQRIDLRSPEASGRMGGIQSGFPVWRLEISLQDTDSDEADAWIAFLDAQRMGLRTFIGRDPSRLYPKANPNGFAGVLRGGLAWDGSTFSWSVNTAGDVLTATGLPANYPIAVRDCVGWKYGASSRTMARFVESATANGSGVLTAAIEPPLPSVVPVDAVCHFDRPGCIMRIAAGETKLPDLDVNHALGGTVVAYQDLLA